MASASPRSHPGSRIPIITCLKSHAALPLRLPPGLRAVAWGSAWHGALSQLYAAVCSLRPIQAAMRDCGCGLLPSSHPSYSNGCLGDGSAINKVGTDSWSALVILVGMRNKTTFEHFWSQPCHKRIPVPPQPQCKAQHPRLSYQDAARRCRRVRCWAAPVGLVAH